MRNLNVSDDVCLGAILFLVIIINLFLCVLVKLTKFILEIIMCMKLLLHKKFVVKNWYYILLLEAF